MSPGIDLNWLEHGGAPRVSGDEPALHLKYLTLG